MVQLSSRHIALKSLAPRDYEILGTAKTVNSAHDTREELISNTEFEKSTEL